MPQTKYDDKKWMYVTVPLGASTIKYAFGTNIKDTESTSLGHTALVDGTGVVIGCSYPKPARASLNDGSKIVSSFVSNDKIGALKNAGWSIQRTQSVSPFGPKQLVEPYSVDVAGVSYGWFMPKTSETKLNAFIGTLGITKMASKADYIKSVCGANFPKPGKIKIAIAGSGTGDDAKVDRISTYCEPGLDLTAVTGTGLLSIAYKRGRTNLANFTGVGTAGVDD